jgi:hypothetical protein
MEADLFLPMVSEVSEHGHLAVLLLDPCSMSQNIMYSRENHLTSEQKEADNKRKDQGSDTPFKVMLQVTHIL